MDNVQRRADNLRYGMRFLRHDALPSVALVAWGVLSLAGVVVCDAQPLSYSLVSGNELWPADKRAAIVAAMDEGVAHYNAHGYFPRHLTVNYDTNVPTANANYNGRINFGGQISARTAIHEISHTLGVGTVGAWGSLRSGGTWLGAHANARLQLYEGPAATIGCDSQHFWPYGLNFATEDGYLPRIRHVRMVSALRRDMGLVADSDSDGLPDDWEQFHFQTLAYNGADDFDADAEDNLTEYENDTDPRDGISAFTTTLLVNSASAAAQPSFNFGAATVSAFFGSSASTPNALINSANPAYLGVNSSAFPPDGNVNAINDRDGVAGGADQERLRIELQNRHGLARLTWQWSRADGPLATDGVSISGFHADPQAVFSGGIGAAAPVYSTGRLTFQISAFNGNVNTVTFANPAASSNATLEITVADSTQAGPQFALRSLSFRHFNRPPVATNLTLTVPLGGSATLHVLAGLPVPPDPDGDAVSVSAAGPAAQGAVTFNSSFVTYVSTNEATLDSFACVVSDAHGALATNTVNVVLVAPGDFNRVAIAPMDGGGALAVRLRGMARNRYALEAADSLTPPVLWSAVVTNAAGDDGVVEFIHAPDGEQLFLRTRRVP